MNTLMDFAVKKKEKNILATYSWYVLHFGQKLHILITVWIVKCLLCIDFFLLTGCTEPHGLCFFIDLCFVF